MTFLFKKANLAHKITIQCTLTTPKHIATWVTCSNWLKLAHIATLAHGSIKANAERLYTGMRPILICVTEIVLYCQNIAQQQNSTTRE